MSLLPRYYDPDAGRILLDGRDIRSFDLNLYRRQLGIVSQQPFLFAGSVVVVIATLVVLTAYLQRQGRLRNVVTAEHYHDLGKYIRLPLSMLPLIQRTGLISALPGRHRSSMCEPFRKRLST